MGLFDFLRVKPLDSGDRRCINCFSCYYDKSEGKYTCTNGWAPVDYRYKCKKSPDAPTNCPKFDYKG